MLELEDDNMSISSPVKRRREEEVTVPKEVKRPRENEPVKLPVNVQDLSERTLVETVESAQKVGKRNIVVSEDLIKVIVENSCVVAKLTEAVNRLQKQLDEHERNDRRREEKRIELEQRRVEEWRRDFID